MFMEKNYLKMLSILFVSILLIAGCKKETKITNPEADVQNFNARGDNDACRLVSDSSEFSDLDFTYNQRGLLDTYTLSYYDGFFKMEYNERGQLVKSKFYSEGVVANTIVFTYQNDKVVKETWYDGETSTVVDETVYSFNRNGKAWKAQDFIQDYVSIYKYTPDGDDIAEWDLYVGGLINYTQQYTFFAPHHKAPDAAVPGLDYDFTGINGRLSQDKWYSTSEKDISYDADGTNPVVLLDQDPFKTIARANEHNNITISDYFDKVTQTYVHFKFDYTNCGSGSRDNVESAFQSLPVYTKKTNLIHFSRLGSSKSVKDQMKEIRMGYLSNK